MLLVGRADSCGCDCMALALPIVICAQRHCVGPDWNTSISSPTTRPLQRKRPRDMRPQRVQRRHSPHSNHGGALARCANNKLVLFGAGIFCIAAFSFVPILLLERMANESSSSSTAVGAHAGVYSGVFITALLNALQCTTVINCVLSLVEAFYKKLFSEIAVSRGGFVWTARISSFTFCVGCPASFISQLERGPCATFWPAVEMSKSLRPQ